MSATSSHWSTGLLSRLIRKELSEILRDRRTILTLVLMPLLLYPLLGVAFRTFVSGTFTLAGPTTYLIGTRPGSEGFCIWICLREGQKELKRQDPANESSSDDEKETPPHQRPWPELQSREYEDVELAVREGRVQVGIRVLPPGPFLTRRGDLEGSVQWELIYREDSAAGLEALRFVERICAAENAHVLLRRLREPKLDLPLRPHPLAVSSVMSRKTPLLSGVVPLILILMTITGAVYPAIDVTAGERERGTLEILISAPVPRLAVLIGKYVAVLTVAMLTAVVNLGTMAATLYISGVGARLFGSDGLSLLVFVQVLALLLLFAAFFSAVLLALTSFARSFKEAQAYLVPLMLLALMPGVLSLTPGLSLRGPLALVPLLNVALLTRDLLEGNADAEIAFVVVSATLLYALTALALASRIFGAEAVLYSQSGSWTDLLRRIGGLFRMRRS